MTEVTLLVLQCAKSPGVSIFCLRSKGGGVLHVVLRDLEALVKRGQLTAIRLTYCSYMNSCSWVQLKKLSVVILKVGTSFGGSSWWHVFYNKIC